MASPTTKLHDGVEIPLLGLGTWRSPPESVKQAVKDAFVVGYRHIDCALVYNNEQEIGKAIEESIKEGVITRNLIFVTGKLWNTYHQPDLVRYACEKSLKNLCIKYLDCYLMHWPMAYKEGDDLYPKDENGNIIFSDVDYLETWKAMENLVDIGLCRTIGISNFNRAQTERLLSVARIKPTILQIECHPYMNQSRLIYFCYTNNIFVAAYSPLGSPHSPYKKPGEYPLLEHPTILHLAKNYQRSAAQILIRYQIQRGNIVVTRSINKEHMAHNINICDFFISPQDMYELDKMDCNGRFMTMAAAAGHPHHPFENYEQHDK